MNQFSWEDDKVQYIKKIEEIKYSMPSNVAESQKNSGLV